MMDIDNIEEETPAKQMLTEDYMECWLIHPIDDIDCRASCPNVDKCHKMRKYWRPTGLRLILERGAEMTFGKTAFEHLMDRRREADAIERAPGTPEETLETAGCTGGCPMHPGAPKTEDGSPDCSKCPERC